MYLEKIDISFVGLPGISLDADEQGAVGFSVERLVLIYSRYNLAGDIRSGPQVQFREWLRSRGHSKSSRTNKKMKRRQYVEDRHIKYEPKKR